MPTISALLATFFIFLLVSIPLAIFLYSISSDVTTFYLLIKEKLMNGEMFNGATCHDGMLCLLIEKITNFLSEPQIIYHLNNAVTTAASALLEYTSSVFISIPRMFVKIFIFIFALFYSFRDGKRVVSWLKEILPINNRVKEDLFKRSHDVIFGAVYGTILVSFVQGIAGTIGFIIFGVPSPIFLGLILTLAALIPFIGTALVWVPIAVIIAVKGYVTQDMYVLGQGLGLFIYGALVISLIDNLIKPRIISKEAKLHPVVVLVGLFGGLQLFGPIGLILGPLLLALLITFVDIYKRDRNEINN